MTVKTQGDREAREGLLLAAPSLMFVLVFSTWPLLQALWLSLHRLSFAQDGPGLEVDFVGLANYVELAQNSGFIQALENTALWVGCSVSGRLALGMLLALLLRRDVWIARIGRTVALLPWVMPVVVAGTVWRWMFNGDWGILNHILKQLGFIERNIIWMSMPGFKWIYLFSLSIWKEYPLYYLVLLARLQSIPQDLYEAARVDGANNWSCFRHITLPMLRPVLLILALWGIVWTTTDFGNVWVLTTRDATLATMVYQLAFRSWHVGYGAAVGTYMMLILLTFAALYVSSLSKDQLLA
jgi:multiple sugar transport system permease protein